MFSFSSVIICFLIFINLHTRGMLATLFPKILVSANKALADYILGLPTNQQTTSRILVNNEASWEHD